LADAVFIRKLEIIWSKFTAREQKIIRGVHIGTIQDKDTVSHEFEYLMRVGVVRKTDRGYTLGIPLLAVAIERETRRDVLRTVYDKILLGSKDITSLFSRQEKQLLSVFLASKKKIISRENIAKTVWGEAWEDKYSDWAIDRIVYRIRTKLKSWIND
jgi:hypothetical protein